MDKCELCSKPGTLEPAFGGDPSNDADKDKAWGKLICACCARAAKRRVVLGPWLTATASELRAAARRWGVEEIVNAVDNTHGKPALDRLRHEFADMERDELVLPGSYLEIVREEGDGC